MVHLAPTISVSVDPISAALYAGGAQQFTATVTGASNPAVTWSVSPSTGHGTVDSSGNYTAPASVVAPSIVVVQANSVQDATSRASTDVRLLPSPPVSYQVSPSNGSGPGGLLTFVFWDRDGQTDLGYMNMLISNNGSPVQACFLMYERATNKLYVRNAANSNWLAPVVLGTSSVLTNSECSVNAVTSYSTLEPDGKSLTLRLATAFNSSWSGVKTIHMRAKDAYNPWATWAYKGTWTIP